MQLIPVIDLLDGEAVRAQAGQRDQYRPLHSPLCPSSKPHDVIEAFRSLAPFSCVYVADLNAIENQGDNTAIVTSLVEQFTDTEWWLDGGFAHRDHIYWSAEIRLRPVIGSESQSDIKQYLELVRACSEYHPILSLDTKDGMTLGPDALHQEPQFWPRDVIIMQLERIGINHGPTLKPPQRAGALAHHYFAAGGVRDRSDLDRLKAAGFTGALVASALHDQRIGSAELADYAGPK